jgi:hypothetical protein
MSLLGNMIANMQTKLFPTELTVNEGNSEIQVVQAGLSLRSQRLLKRRIRVPKPAKMAQEEPIKYKSRPNIATYCPNL